MKTNTGFSQANTSGVGSRGLKLSIAHSVPSLCEALEVQGSKNMSSLRCHDH